MQNNEKKQIAKNETKNSNYQKRDFLAEIAQSDHPATVVEEMGVHDLLVSYKNADAEQACSLLALTSPEQFNNLVDITCWDGEKPKTALVLKTVSPLLLSNLEGATLVLDRLEDEILTLVLKDFVIVHLREDKDDLIPAQDDSELIPCPDRYYFIELRNPDDVPDEIRALLTALINKPFEEYQKELECIRHDLVSELEEQSLRWRNGRLEDLGFATYEEGLALISPRSVKDAKAMINNGASPVPPLSDGPSVPEIYKENLYGNELLDASLKLLSQSSNAVFMARAENIWPEISAMTNLFMTATKCDIADVAAVSLHARWARDLLGLGLHAVSDGNPNKAAEALAIQVPGLFLQTAMGIVLPLRDRARAIINHPRFKILDQPGGLLDPPYYSTLFGLSKDLPLFWTGLTEGKDLTYGFPEPLPSELCAFGSPKQVDLATTILEEVEVLDELLFDRFGWSVPEIPADELIDEAANEMTTATSLILTALANAFHQNDPTPEPLWADAAEDFVVNALKQHEDDFCSQAFAVFADQLELPPIETLDVNVETDPLTRLLIRLVFLGQARLNFEGSKLSIIIKN